MLVTSGTSSGPDDMIEVIDIATASDGRFGPDPQHLLAHWLQFVEAADALEGERTSVRVGDLANPVGEPRQVFAIGLNYRSHAAESGMQIPDVPATFTKFPTSLAGPFDDVEVIGASVDWEVEVVAVIGQRADRVELDTAWQYIAGLTVGQDISDRHLQFAAGMQFSLGKSRRGYGPMGPWLVSTDEFTNPDDLELRCSIDGEVMQQARTSDLIFSIPQLVAELSAVLPLLPGDVIFTGTPSGVGMAQQPPRSLEGGSIIESWVEGIGNIRNRCVS